MFMRWSYEENAGILGEFSWNLSNQSNFEILGRECASLVAFAAHAINHGNSNMLLVTVLGDQFLVMVQRELWNSYELVEDLFHEDGGVGLEMILSEERSGNLPCCSIKITSDRALRQFVSHVALMKKSALSMHMCDRKIVLQMPLPLPLMQSFCYFDNTVVPSRDDVNSLLRFVERAIETAPQVPVLVHTHTGSYITMVDQLHWNSLDDPMKSLKARLNGIQSESVDCSQGFASMRLLHVSLLLRLRVILAALGHSTLTESLPHGEELVAYTGNDRRALKSAVRRRLHRSHSNSSSFFSSSFYHCCSGSDTLTHSFSSSFRATNPSTSTDCTRPHSASNGENPATTGEFGADEGN